MSATPLHQSRCRKCGSINIVRNGHNRSGSQQYLCKDCGASGVLHPKQGYSPERRAEILRAYQEYPSMRAISRRYGVSRKTLSTWIHNTPGLAKATPDASSKGRG
ncbi:transposase [candidate division KSB3 bacterium]|uniref:Transposase n=1 Tax=candidate division KSB3 bacterium TaxID=2044937 RepID=A0A9D5JUG5_9BACT|nr:transposase [candidate division KSB3 bacterium]MBD3324473.1 transposase [candidate division KSB3 bacterium]